MKVILEEYGLLLVSVISGVSVLGVASGLCESIQPMVEMFLNSIM